MIFPMNCPRYVADHGLNPVKDSVVWILVNFRGLDFAVKPNYTGYAVKRIESVRKKKRVCMKVLLRLRCYF